MNRRDPSGPIREQDDLWSRRASRSAMVAALALAVGACNLESARLPDGRRIADKPWRVQWRFARAQASRDFGCAESNVWPPPGAGIHELRFRGCGQTARYACRRYERRADQDIEQELDHVWEVHYVCRRL